MYLSYSRTRGLAAQLLESPLIARLYRSCRRQFSGFDSEYARAVVEESAINLSEREQEIETRLL